LPPDGLLAARVCLAQRLPAGDPVRLRAVARRSGALAAELRRAAAVLLAGVEAGLWAGAAHRAFVERVRVQAPNLGATAERYEHYAFALIGYAGVLDEVGPRLAGARRLLQQRHDELTARSGMSAGFLPAAAAGGLDPGVGATGRLPPGSPDPGVELLPVAWGFKADYDRWADALDHCTGALLQANDTDPTRDAHGLRALQHRIAGATGAYLAPLEQVVRHPSLHTLSTSLGELNAGLSVLGLGLLFLCPPAAAACLLTATVLAAAQLGVDATRRAQGEHISSASLGLELAAAVPIGGGAVRGLRAAENVTHLVPGGGLLAHEGLDGGHTLTKHVGKTEEYLRHRLATEPHITGASSFYNREVAENALAALLHHNWGKVATWLSTSKQELILSGQTDSAIGMVILRDSSVPVDARGIRLIIRRSPALPAGFRIHTAMVTM
jgi:hypothetical protein